MSDQPEPAPPSPPPATRRRGLAALFALLLIAALVGGAYYLVQRTRAPAPGPAAGPAPAGGASVTVGAASAEAGTLPIVIDALGTVTPPVIATLVPQVSGVLTEVLFTEGQAVKKGQVLARIDPRSYEQALAQARAQTARDAAQLAAARVTLARYQELWQQDSIARQTLDSQTALVQQLDAAVQADRASERAARLNLDFTTLRAPVAGRIGLRAVDPGNLVSSGTSSGIATITQVEPIDVVFAVPQDRVPAVLAAQRAAAGPPQGGANPLGGQRTTRSGEAWGPQSSGALPVVALDRARQQQLAEGRFLTLDNQVNTTTGTVRAKARFDNADGALFPNQFVNARLQLGSEAGVLVPVTAVRTGPQGDYVYVIDEQQLAHMRPVTRGMATAERVLVSAGLQAGERVVTEGGDRVKDGGRVQLAGAAPQGAAGGAHGARPGGATAEAGSAGRRAGARR